MRRIEIKVVSMVRKAIGLDPNHTPMLPPSQMALKFLPPGTNIRREVFVADLQRQELVFGAQRCAPYKSLRDGVKVFGEKIVNGHCLCCWASVAIENDIGEVTIDVSEHLRHKVLAELAAIIAQAARMFRVARQEHQSDIFERIAAKHYSPATQFMFA
jgi:hypothetical protein